MSSQRAKADWDSYLPGGRYSGDPARLSTPVLNNGAAVLTARLQTLQHLLRVETGDDRRELDEQIIVIEPRIDQLAAERRRRHEKGKPHA